MNVLQLTPIVRTLCVFILLGSNLIFCYSQSQEKIDSLIQVLESTQSKEAKAETLLNLSAHYMTLNPNEGLEYANSAISLAEELDMKTLLAKAYNFQGGNWLYLSEGENALESFTIAKKLYMDLGLTSKAAEIIGNIGNLRAQQGDFKNALKNQYEALSLLDPESEFASINNTHLAIGDIFMQLGKIEEALKHDSIALNGYILSDDEYGVALCRGNLANIFIEQGKDEIAKENYLEAITIYELANAPFDLIRELSNLSTLYEQQGEITEAIALSERVIKLSKENNFIRGLAVGSGNLGSYYLTALERRSNNVNNFTLPSLPKAQLIDSATHYLKKSISTGIEINGAAHIAAVTENLSKVQVEDGNMEEAYFNFKSANEIKDSIYSLETKKEIETLTTEREIALKDKQIELDRLAVLKKRNERLYFGIGLGLLFLLLIAIYRNYKNQKKSNIQLSLTNNDLSSTLTKLHETQEQLIDVERQKEKALIRTRISQDIHDDISSSLTKISWLSELIQSEKTQTQKGKLTELAQKINESSNDTVSKLSEIIWSTNPEADNLGSLLSYMRSHLNSFLEDSDIQCSINFPEEDLSQKISPELRRNLFLILKESVNNAFKYSKANSLKINFNVKGDHYNLSIKDNGVGFEQGKVLGSGNGMNNMLARINKVGGTIQVRSTPGKGTVVKCNGPIRA